MTPKEFQTWFAKPINDEITLTETLDMKGLTLTGAGKTVRGGTLKRVRLVGTDCTFDGVTFDCAPLPEDKWFVPIGAYIDGSKHITFTGCKFGGGSLEKGIGLRGNDVEDVSVIGCEFKDGYQGPSFLRAKRILVEGCDLHHLGENGVTIAGCLGLTVRDNFIHDITPVNGAHPDAIQTWTYRQPSTAGDTYYPVNDVLIEGNVILQGSGGGMQGIFHRSGANAVAGADPALYRCHNWTVRNNLVYGFAYTNAIYLNEGVDGVTIEGNLVISPFDAQYQGWIYLKGCANLTIRRNVANNYLECPKDVLKSNILTKDVASLIPDLNKRALATEAGLRLQVGGVRLLVG